MLRFLQYNKRMMKTLMDRKQIRGFTIVELSLTIIVISILTSIAIISYNGVQTRSRDDVRETDVALVMDALEQYYRKNGDYPANDTMNPSQNYPNMLNYTAIKGLLPSLTDDTLSGPGGYTFYPACVNSAWCVNGASNWVFRKKNYIYLSRFTDGSAGSYWWYRVPSSWENNTGWGCGVQTYYTNPGYAIAWYSESKKLWIFKRSQYGQIDIANWDTGPIAPQTCTFS
jgi:prepilin-type N-terminal cleavage/methylation domain-containing protein